MKKIIVLFLALSAVLTSFVSCGKQTKDVISAQKGLTKQVVDGVFYEYDKNTIYKRYLLPEEGVSEKIAVCTDSLCTHKKGCPLYIQSIMYSYVVDEAETRKNDNSPVIYFFDGAVFKRYDGSNNTVKVIAEFPDGKISSMWVYGDRIYFSFYTQNEYQLRCFDKDGGNEKTLSRANADINFRMFAFDENYVYYGDVLLGYYRATLDLTEEEYLFSTNMYATGTVYGGYLYYGANETKTLVGEKTNLTSCTIYRRDVTNIDAPAEVVDENVITNTAPIFFRFGEKFVYCKPNDPKKVGEHMDMDIVYEIVESGSGKIFFYDVNTKEKGVLCEDIGGDTFEILYVDDQYIVAVYLENIFDESGSFKQTVDRHVYCDYVSDKKYFFDQH